uniref:WD repeat-containing protein 55 homolog n=1 Tax=Caenorhabditis japonica TaxID=281687 RepID=A0A8R1I5K0_CAEJA
MSKRPVIEAQKPVWHDEDDDNVVVTVPKRVKKTMRAELKRTTDEEHGEVDSKEYVARLQEAFKKRHGGTPKWALAAATYGVEDEEESLLRSAAGYLAKDSKLPKTTIHTSYLKDFNIGHRFTRPITVVKFHKTRPVLITADQGGNVQLFKVSREVRQDHFLQSATFKKFPIDCMEIAEQGTAVICSSSSKEYLMQYNMETRQVTELRPPNTVPKQGIRIFAISHDSKFLALAGHNSHIYIVHAVSMEHVKTISLPANATAIKFYPTHSRELWVICENGQIVIASMSCDSVFKVNKQHTFTDDGAVHGTTIALTQHGEFFATGSDTGIVNVYSGQDCRDSTTPRPLFNVSNLVTSVSSIAFTSDAQLMAICSSVKENHLRLVHIASQTTFKNFPDRHGKVTHARCVDFSPNGGYLAVGNEDGKLNVFSIHHFRDY